MSRTSIDAGKLRDRLQVLELTEAPAGTWSWQSVRAARGQVELSTSDRRSNLFSSVGIGARGAEVLLRRAVRTEDTVGEGGRPKAAETLRLTFPGVLTEKYARYEREETHAENETSYVLVTPKVIQLRSGDLVTVQEGPAKGVYHVAVCHVLDAWKNEYEIVWRGDV